MAIKKGKSIQLLAAVHRQINLSATDLAILATGFLRRGVFRELCTLILNPFVPITVAWVDTNIYPRTVRVAAHWMTDA
jgi:hypothetical protein